VAALRCMPLATLLDGVPGERLGRFDDRGVTMLATDSRRVVPGALFFALPGETGHGREHAVEAAQRGAAALVAPDHQGLPEGLPALVTPAPRALLAPLAARLYGYPGDALALYGVTGTNGKTTTALMTAAVLSGGGLTTGHWTTTEVRAGGSFFRPFWTTPPPPDLERFLAACVDAGAQAAVLEVSSHAVTLGRVDGLAFRFGAATNLSPDHLDFHGDFASYAAAKRAFIHGLGEGSVAALNGDDAAISAFGEDARARVVRFGWGAAADLRLSDLHESGGRLAARLRIGPADLRPGGEPDLELSLPMPGAHNAMNAAAALAAGLTAGLDARRVLDALATFAPPARRLERRRIGPFTVTNDVAMNEASYDTVLRWAGTAGHTQVVVVCALRGHRGADVSAAIARVFARHAGALGLAPLLVSLSRDETAAMAVDHRVRDEELEAFRRVLDQAGVAVEVHPDLAGTIDRAVERLAPGGLLLLLGTFGMDDGPRLAEEALGRRLGIAHEVVAAYPAPSYGAFDGEEDS
jgi:UDP-N-acetylmuramoyl-L-alanyl-D-glutamate--2,6-diaminopimelate ligase